MSLHSSVLDLLSHLYSILWLFLTSAVAETAFSEISFLRNILKDKNFIIKYIPLYFLPLQKVMQPMASEELCLRKREERFLFY